MKNLIFFLLIVLTGCSFQNENIQPKIKPEHQKLIGNYHPFVKKNGRDNSTFLPFTTYESVIINQWYNAYNLIPIPRQLEQFVVAVDWFDWEHDVTEDITFEIYAAPPSIANTQPSDSVFVLVGSASSFDLGMSLDLTTSYPAQFGSIDHKQGQYIFFKFQWRDSLNNISTPVYESTQIQLDSAAELSGVKATVDGWLHHGPGDQFNDSGYTIDSIEELHIDDTVTSVGGSFFIIESDTTFHNVLYVGNLHFSMVKTNPCVAGVGFMFDTFGTYIQNDDWSGTCCSPLLGGTSWFATAKVHSACPITLHYKFDGIKASFHL